MINLDFRKKSNGVPILSKDEIEILAEMVINDYNPKLLNEPGILDVEDFAESYTNLEMDYKDLTHNQSILGMTVFCDCYIPVYNAEQNKAERIPVDEGTIIIDNCLLNDSQLRRGRFTLGHEISHWLLHRHIYMINKNQMSLFDLLPNDTSPVIKCRSIDIENTGRRQLKTDDDWIEWQADYMASALLMPKKAFTRAVNQKFKAMGLKKNYFEVGTDLELNLRAQVLSYELADLFDVSVTAVKIRLKGLNFIRKQKESNQLLFTI